MSKDCEHRAAPRLHYIGGAWGVCDECLDGAEGICETSGCAYHSAGTPRPGVSLREACEKGGIKVTDHPTWCANCNEARARREAQKDDELQYEYAPIRKEELALSRLVGSISGVAIPWSEKEEDA